MRGRNNTLVRVSWISGLEHLVALGKVGGKPSREIGTDLRPGASSRVDEHRAVTNVAVQGRASLIRVIRLWESPDVRVTNSFPVPVPDSHLVIKGLAIVVPHFLQPIEPEFRLVSEVRSAGAR